MTFCKEAVSLSMVGIVQEITQDNLSGVSYDLIWEDLSQEVSMF